MYYEDDIKPNAARHKLLGEKPSIPYIEYYRMFRQIHNPELQERKAKLQLHSQSFPIERIIKPA